MYRTSMDPPPSISPPFYPSCLLAVAVTVTVTVKVTVNVTVTVVRVSPQTNWPQLEQRGSDTRSESRPACRILWALQELA